MTNTELKELQQRIKFDAPSMALCLGIPYHTYRNYYFGSNKIPANIERAARELEQINITFIEERYKPGGEFDREIDRMHPNGIISEVSV